VNWDSKCARSGAFRAFTVFSIGFHVISNEVDLKIELKGGRGGDNGKKRGSERRVWHSQVRHMASARDLWCLCEAGNSRRRRSLVCAEYLVLQQKTKLTTWLSWLLLSFWRKFASAKAAHVLFFGASATTVCLFFFDIGRVLTRLD